MSIDKTKVDALIKRVEELTIVLNDITADLREVTSSLKSMAVAQITQPVTAPPPLSLSQPSTVVGAPHVAEKSKAVEDIRMMFPDELENLLSFEERDEFVIIKPRQFLGSDNFSKIASTIRQVGGEYVSAGKASHFKVPKRRA